MASLNTKYLERLVESSRDIIVAVDRAGTIIYYNDGARKNLHYQPDEIIGQKVTRIYPSPEEARRVMKAMRESTDAGRISNFETVFRDQDDEIIPVAISGSIIFDESGNEIGSIGFARDIRPMRLREQLATAGEIAVSLAHEMNNPLAAIVNNLDLLSRTINERCCGAELMVAAEHIESIRASLRRMQAIVQRLDEMAQQGTYLTRDYLQGKRMTDLTPRDERQLCGPISELPSAGGEPFTAAVERGGEWPLSGMAVLVLDDDVSVVNSLAELLRAERCVAYTATRPSSALGILRNVRIDAVISDVVMPEMDGYEFYMRVKEEMPDLPVLLMTAYYYDRDHIIKRSRLEGLSGSLFKKPVNPAKLRELLIQMRQKERVRLSAESAAEHHLRAPGR